MHNLLSDGSKIMRGRSSTLPKHRKHKASGQAIVTLSGKMHYLGPHGTKTRHVEYDRLIQEWLAHGRRLPPTADMRPQPRNRYVTREPSVTALSRSKAALVRP